MSADTPLADELLGLLSRLSYRKGTFRLASGKSRDFYVDVKQTVYTGAGASLIGRMICHLLALRSIELVGGMALGAIPLVDATLNEAARRGWAIDGLFVRKDVKEHGTAAKLDGRFDAGKRIAILEDVVNERGVDDSSDRCSGAGGRAHRLRNRRCRPRGRRRDEEHSAPLQRPRRLGDKNRDSASSWRALIATTARYQKTGATLVPESRPVIVENALSA